MVFARWRTGSAGRWEGEGWVELVRIGHGGWSGDAVDEGMFALLSGNWRVVGLWLAESLMGGWSIGGKEF